MTEKNIIFILTSCKYTRSDYLFRQLQFVHVCIHLPDKLNVIINRFVYFNVWTRQCLSVNVFTHFYFFINTK